MNRLLPPRLFLPFILGAAVLAGLLTFADVSRVAALVAGFQPMALVYFAVLLLAYEAVRWVQWHLLLGALGVRVRLRTQLFTFMAGEAARDLPAGNFVPTYLLQSTNGTAFGLASAATLLITLLEVGVSLTVVVIVGIAGWAWLRPLILIGLTICALLAGALSLWLRAARPHCMRARGWMARHTATRRALDELRRFAHGQVLLLRPRVLVVATALSATYLGLGGAGVYVVARGLGLERIGFWQLVAAYCFSIAFAAIVPLPMDFGSVEASGTGALVAEAVAQSAAAGLMLLTRLLSVAFTLLLAAVVWVVLRQEAQAALHVPAAAQPPLALSVDRVTEGEWVEMPAECDPCAA